MRKAFNSKLNIFLIISFFGTISFFVLLMFSKDSKPFDWLVMEHNYSWQFSDFFRQIVYASDLKNIYFNTNDAPFPPLAYIFYNLLYKMNPRMYEVSLRSWRECANFQYNQLIFLMVELVNVILLYEIIKKNFKKISNKKIILFVVAILFSAPFFVGTLERGNAALMVLTFVLISLYLKDSENTWHRQISLILLAIAVGFKLYPGIFILLWLKEKRYEDVLFFIIYCIVFVLFPFAFTGGIQGLIVYCQNLLRFDKIQEIRWTSINLYYYSLCKTLNFNYIEIISNIIRYAFLIMSCLVVINEEKWKKYLSLATLMAVFVTASHRYVSIYLLIPLIYFLKDDKVKEIKDIIYTILFALIFTIPVWAASFEVDFAIFTPIYLLNFIVIGETICLIIKNKKVKVNNYKLIGENNK